MLTFGFNYIGTIPLEISNLRNLVYLNFENNSLHGYLNLYCV